VQLKALKLELSNATAIDIIGLNETGSEQRAKRAVRKKSTLLRKKNHAGSSCALHLRHELFIFINQ
jgi:hypothetical protein